MNLIRVIRRWFWRIKMNGQAGNYKKFKEMIVYFASKSINDPKFGATKLNKLLFYSDFRAYGLRSKSISGVDYYALKMGPVPASRIFLDVRKQLVGDGSVRLEKVPYFGFSQDKLVAQREADLQLFSDEELRLMDDVLTEFANYDAKDISEESHGFIGWKIAYNSSNDNKIPYNTVFFSNHNVSIDDTDRTIAEGIEEFIK